MRGNQEYQMTERRTHGAGTIEPYRGRFRARLARTPEGARPTVGIYDTEEEAERMLDAVAVVAARENVPLASRNTVRGYGERFLDRRERRGIRDVRSDRSRWKTHIATADFIDWPLEKVQRRDVREWLDELAAKRVSGVQKKKKRKISFQTKKHCLIVLRMMFDAAIEDELITKNPCAGIKLEHDGDTEESWTYLTLQEQTQIATCQAIPEADRLRILFSIYTGMRQGEQWNLELADLRIDDPCPHVVVRFGSKGRSTKNKKIRRVPLMPAALALAKRWLRMLPAYASENTEGLVFPTPRGCRRQKAKTYGFKKHLALAGITRPVRWHDLRHTCASSLVAGWWGRPWRLEEVKEVLGHSSINVTERYAHLAPSVIARAAAETKIEGSAEGKNWPTDWPTLSENPPSAITDPASFLRRAPPDSNGRPADSKSDALSS